MVADELALSLATRYVRPHDVVLDPFCGSGRLLAAAAHVTGRRVGIDVNPLACLVTRAKLANPDAAILSEILASVARSRSRAMADRSICLREPRKVEWFAPAMLGELSQIVRWINSLKLDEPEKLVVASVLSAASRDVSYARKDGWKLHRLPADERAILTISPWEVFEHRLRYCVSEIMRRPPLRGVTDIRLGDARFLSTMLRTNQRFDVVLTSPPYGDSRTTVQYGAASALCLEFVSRIKGMEEFFLPGAQIDKSCLGAPRRSSEAQSPYQLRRYWAGQQDAIQGRRVRDFLADYQDACTGMASCLKPGGTIVVIVGQRSTGRFRVKLDRFTIDQLEARGLRVISIEERRLQEKQLPRRINRFGRCASASLRRRGLTRTMSSEAILVFRKPNSH